MVVVKKILEGRLGSDVPGYADRYFQSKESVFALLRICSIAGSTR
jgi:hypothetical protein